MSQSITLVVVAIEQNAIRELSLAETLVIGGAVGVDEFPVIPR